MRKAAGDNSNDEEDVGCDSNIVTGGGGDVGRDNHNNDDAGNGVIVGYPRHVRLFDSWVTHHLHRVQL